MRDSYQHLVVQSENIESPITGITVPHHEVVIVMVWKSIRTSWYSLSRDNRSSRAASGLINAVFFGMRSSIFIQRLKFGEIPND